MVSGERSEQGESNVGAATAGPFWVCEGSSGVNSEGDNVTNRVKGGISKVRQQVLFICDLDGESVFQRITKFLYV